MKITAPTGHRSDKESPDSRFWRSMGVTVLLSLLLGVFPFAAGAADAAPDEDVRRTVLLERLKQIDAEQQASARQFAADKSACTRKILVSRCTGEALARRRARDDVLGHSDTAARAELRGLALIGKNRALAGSLPTAERDRVENEERREAKGARERKRADVLERRAEHERKKALEAENRLAWEAKQARAAEKLADMEARRKEKEAASKAAGAASSAGAGSKVATPAVPALKASAN